MRGSSECSLLSVFDADSILYDIYNVPVEDVYPTYCENLGKLFRFDGYFYSYFYFDEGSSSYRTFDFRASSNIPEKALSDYADRLWAIDYIRWFMDSADIGPFRDTDVIPPAAYEQSAFFKNWVEPLGFYYSAIAPVVVNGKIIVSLDLLRGKESGDFTESELQLLKLFNRHLCARFAREYPHGISLSKYIGADETLKQLYHLTSREAEIAILLTQQKSRSAICGSLYISENTYKKHLSNIYKKVHVSSLGELTSKLAYVEGAGGKGNGGTPPRVGSGWGRGAPFRKPHPRP